MTVHHFHSPSTRRVLVDRLRVSHLLECKLARLVEPDDDKLSDTDFLAKVAERIQVELRDRVTVRDVCRTAGLLPSLTRDEVNRSVLGMIDGAIGRGAGERGR